MAAALKPAPHKNSLASMRSAGDLFAGVIFFGFSGGAVGGDLEDIDVI